MNSKWLFRILVAVAVGVPVTAAFLFFMDNVTLFAILCGAAAVELILAWALYRNLIGPHNAMLMGVDLLAAQDFSTRLRPVGNAETRRVVGIFNRMIDELRKERLAEQERNYFLNLLLEESAQGVIILDVDGRISLVNRVGARLLEVDGPQSLIGRTLEETDGELARILISLKPEDDRIVRLSGQAVYRCLRSSFVDKGFDRPFFLIEEMTRELMRIEKESYERVIRMMAHEVNNSIGGIGTTLNVVGDILAAHPSPEWDDVADAVEAAGERCRSIGGFIDRLADVVRIPAPVIDRVSLGELIRTADAFTRIECQRRDITLTISLPPEEIFIEADGIQLEQVLINILKNAYQAIGRGGEIRITATDNPPTLTVADNGPGISADVQGKLFAPFFTTKPNGQGIGLTLIREVLLAHGFRFGLTVEDGWTVFRIVFTEDGNPCR